MTLAEQLGDVIKNTNCGACNLGLHLVDGRHITINTERAKGSCPCKLIEAFEAFVTAREQAARELALRDAAAETLAFAGRFREQGYTTTADALPQLARNISALSTTHTLDLALVGARIEDAKCCLDKAWDRATDEYMTEILEEHVAELERQRKGLLEAKS